MTKIFFASFDVSADHYIANIIAYLRKSAPNQFQFLAFAGEETKKLTQNFNDLTFLEDTVTNSSVGFLEALPKLLPSFFLVKRLQKIIKYHQPNIVFCVDGQGINLLIGKILKQMGLKTIYYIPPPLFIWGKNNAKKLQFFDKILCIFQKNHQTLLKYNLPSTYIGHPFSNYRNQSNQFSLTTNFSLRQYLKVNQSTKIISLFPGSRLQEINQLSTLFFQTAKELKQQFKENITFVISLAHKRFYSLINNNLKKQQISIPIIHGKWEEIAQESYFMITCSGTVTLKASFLGIPHVTCYKISPLSYWFIRLFIIYVPYITMLNILNEKEIVKELINSHLTVKSLVQYVSIFIENEQLRFEKSQELLQTTHSLVVDDPFKGILLTLQELAN